MFADTGELRLGKAKSVLKKQLQVEVSMRHTSSRISCLVVNGSAVIYTIHWPVDDYIDNFKSFIRQKLKQCDVYLVFDRYMSYSTKSVTRSGRQSNVSKVYQLTCDMTIPSQNVTLGVTENKRQLVCSELCTNSYFHQLYTHTHKLTVTGEGNVPTEIHKGVIIDRVDLIKALKALVDCRYENSEWGVAELQTC